jgi:Raf kinase inhibitor-like YbhB/YbcL family protein
MDDEPPINEAPPGGLELMSPVFMQGGVIPEQYTCRGQNINPPLNILNPPAGTLSYTLIMHDPDAPGGDYLHWLLWDIPPVTESILPNSVPVGAIQGYNDADTLGYTGPCPPKGTGIHRYIFELYALDRTLDLDRSARRAEVEKTMHGHILDETTLTGVVAAD